MALVFSAPINLMSPPIPRYGYHNYGPGEASRPPRPVSPSSLGSRSSGHDQTPHSQSRRDRDTELDRSMELRNVKREEERPRISPLPNTAGSGSTGSSSSSRFTLPPPNMGGPLSLGPLGKPNSSSVEPMQIPGIRSLALGDSSWASERDPLRDFRTTDREFSRPDMERALSGGTSTSTGGMESASSNRFVTRQLPPIHSIEGAPSSNTPTPSSLPTPLSHGHTSLGGQQHHHTEPPSPGQEYSRPASPHYGNLRPSYHDSRFPAVPPPHQARYNPPQQYNNTYPHAQHQLGPPPPPPPPMSAPRHQLPRRSSRDSVHDAQDISPPLRAIQHPHQYQHQHLQQQQHQHQHQPPVHPSSSRSGGSGGSRSSTHPHSYSPDKYYPPPPPPPPPHASSLPHQSSSSLHGSSRHGHGHARAQSPPTRPGPSHHSHSHTQQTPYGRSRSHSTANSSSTANHARSAGPAPLGGPGAGGMEIVGGGQTRRLAHLMSEQKRRESINSGFKALRVVIPSATSTDSKAVILRKAASHIKNLEAILHQAGIPISSHTSHSGLMSASRSESLSDLAEGEGEGDGEVEPEVEGEGDEDMSMDVDDPRIKIERNDEARRDWREPRGGEQDVKQRRYS